MADVTDPDVRPRSGVILRQTRWTVDRSCQSFESDGSLDASDVVWIDVSPDAKGEETLAAVRTFCRGEVSAKEVDAFLGKEQDKRCVAELTRGKVRLTRAFAVVAVEPDVKRSEGRQVGELLFQPVSILTGTNWLLTRWHEIEPFPESGNVASDRAADLVGFQTCFDAVKRRWCGQKRGETAGDLGVLILHELVLSFAPAYREVERWLEAWELRHYHGEPDSGQSRRKAPDSTELRAIWALMDRLRRWIQPLNRPGISDDLERAWFPGARDHELVQCVDDRIDQALKALGEFAGVLRESFAHVDRERKEDRQRRIEVIAAAFLIPSLVVGFYGANTRLPGGNETWPAFVAMSSAIVVLTTLGVLAILWANRRARRSG